VVVWAAQFVYAIPVVLLAFCVTFAFLGASNNNDGLLALAVVSLCLLIFFAIALVFIMPALYVQYIRYGDFGPMFKFGEVIGVVRENFVDILLTVVVSIVGALAIGIVATILLITICGAIIAYAVGTAWLMLSLAYLYGKIARRYAKEETGAIFAT
jgi:hypothetical protein